MIAILIVYGIVGACLGSFLRYLSYTHGFKEIFSSRSECDHCHKKLNRYELIPVFSRLYQKGKCKSCQTSLSTDYPISEIITGIIFMFTAYQIWFSAFEIQIIVTLIVSCLVYMAMVDIKNKELSIPSYIFAIVLLLGLYFLLPEISHLNLLYSALIWFALWIVIWFIGSCIHKLKYKSWGQGLGFGDVLFAALLGLIFELGLSVHPDQAELGSNYYFLVFLGAILHMFFSSCCGILGFIVLKDERLAFIPYMLSGFVIMTIVLLYFSDYFRSFLAF